MEVVRYTQDRADEWNRFNAFSKNGLFMFNRSYMDYHSDRFTDNSLMFYHEGKLMALLPLSIDGSTAISHGGLTFGGFITNSTMKQHKISDCFSALVGYMREYGINNLIYKKSPYIYSKIPTEEDIYSLWHCGGVVKKIEPSSVINLQDIPKMPKGRKAQISRAKRKGVMVGESLDFEHFMELEKKVLKKYHNATPTHTAEEISLLHSRFPNNIFLYTVELNSEIIAGNILFIYSNIVHTQYLASSGKGREIGALDLLIYTLIEKYKKEKQYFDFGISSENNGVILNNGLISQKEGFGARTVVYETYEIKK